MNRILRTVTGVVLILIITFSAISICQDIGRSWKVDITEQGIYTLSKGTRAILSRLDQPIKIKLYYAKTAAQKASDQIRYFNTYYKFVKELLDEYVAAANGMIKLELIDPRPFSDEEVQALRYGLKRFPITEEEGFFFGLVVQTPFGVEKSIPFFSPDRQRFLEYDISYLIDTAITREKSRIGILSSLPVMGDDPTGRLAQFMRMQGRRLRPAWTIVEQLRQKYEVKQIPADTNSIEDVDILLVIHPKNLSEKTLFAIDQFVLKGGRTIICVDPYCIEDRRDPMMMQMGRQQSQSSELNTLTKTWGVELAPGEFAGDRDLALFGGGGANQAPQRVIGFLGLTRQCFNHELAMTAELNLVRFLFAGVLKEVDFDDPNEAARINRTPLLTTTARGNSWRPELPLNLAVMNPEALMDSFSDGTEPVAMGYMVTGKFKSSFPDGIEVEAESSEEASAEDPNSEAEPKKKRITGLAEAREGCAVVIFSDVDFITDLGAYRDLGFGMRVPSGDNAALLLNAIEELSGSSDLISIRSRGNFRRPFTVVDRIESEAAKETAAEEEKLNREIQQFQNELRSILTAAQQGEQAEVVGSSILQKRRDLELKIAEANRQLRQVRMKKRERIERLGKILQNVNMLTAPAVILLIAIGLGIYRAAKRRHYISHASDA